MLARTRINLAGLHQEQAALLVNAPKRFYESKRLNVYDKGSRNTLSGIQCTMFGGTSALGSTLGGSLTRIGSQCIYPYRSNASIWDNRIKELKTMLEELEAEKQRHSKNHWSTIFDLLGMKRGQR